MNADIDNVTNQTQAQEHLSNQPVIAPGQMVVLAAKVARLPGGQEIIHAANIFTVMAAEWIGKPEIIGSAHLIMAVPYYDRSWFVNATENAPYLSTELDVHKSVPFESLTEQEQQYLASGGIIPHDPRFVYKLMVNNPRVYVVDKSELRVVDESIQVIFDPLRQRDDLSQLPTHFVGFHTVESESTEHDEQPAQAPTQQSASATKQAPEQAPDEPIADQNGLETTSEPLDQVIENASEVDSKHNNEKQRPQNSYASTSKNASEGVRSSLPQAQISAQKAKKATANTQKNKKRSQKATE